MIDLPRRVWSDDSAREFARVVSRRLARTPHVELRPIQAQGLLDAHKVRGLFAPIRVGGGKTLLSFLLVYILKARRPLLLLPAKLAEKARREMKVLAVDWEIPNYIRIESYELLGRTQSAEMLDRYRPDLIIADEAHKLKSPKAAVTKRVRRYLDEFPETMVCAMSGSFLNRSIKECAHILVWALKPMGAPVPFSYTELEEWASAIDRLPVGGGDPVEPGALEFLVPLEIRNKRHPTITDIREGFRSRFTETPGVVASSGAYTGASLTISPIVLEAPAVIDEAFHTLRTMWELPDGTDQGDYAVSVWRHAREMALGFFYQWDPLPPFPWLQARKFWNKASRHILSHNRSRIDSPLQVAQAVDGGHYPEFRSLLEAWRAIEPTYTPTVKPVWLDDFAIKRAIEWAQGLGHNPAGLIWTEHRAFAERLSYMSGFPYFGAKGLDKTGRRIEDYRGISIVSIKANSEGRNLQDNYAHNLITSPPTTNKEWEQLIARTHRDLQRAEEVIVDVFLGCLEHLNAFAQAWSDGQLVQQTMGQPQKLGYGDILYPYPDRPGDVRYDSSSPRFLV